MVVVECFDLKFDGGLYGGLTVMAVAHSGANSDYGGQLPLASQNQIKPTTKKKKKFETHEALPPTPPPPQSEPTTQHHHHLTHNPQPPQATTHNPTIIRSLSNPKPKKEKKKRKPMKQR